MRVPRVYLLAGGIAVLLLGGIAFAASAQGGSLAIEQAYFVAAAPSGADLNLTARLFVTNHGHGESGPMDVTVFVVPQQSGLASYTTTRHVGAIAARTTEPVSIDLIVPRFNDTRNYRIDFLVFEDGLLTQRGVGSIGWNGGYDGDGRQLYAADSLVAGAPSFQKVG